MQLNLIAWSMGLAALAAANPLLGLRAVTPDNSCGLTGAGNNKGYSCDTSVTGGGRCCSQNGWCGSTDAYCGTGCQAAYGSCGTQTTTTTKKATTTTTTTKKISTTTSAASAPSGTSTTNCGPSYGNAICAKGLCCSQYGWCSDDAAHCGTGCQPKFGSCSVQGTTTTLKTTTTTTTTQKTTTASTPAVPSGTSTTNCGPSYGNAICAKGLCCSQYGWCNGDADHCGTGCQPKFGTCGVQSSSTTPNQGSSTTASFNGSPTGSTLNCGPSYGNQVCLSGLCCSVDGWCNNDPDHCGTGCQPNFGACGDQSNHPTGPQNSTTVCGPSNGYAVCAKGLCCSIGGNCGTGEDYCADPFNCQFGYGDCDSSQTPAGTSTINDPRPVLGSLSYSQDIYDCTAPNVVALTYDDGPLQYTDHLLDLLKQYNFKATFFITGNNVGKGAIDTTAPWPTLVKRMISEGHQVASHTWSHYDLGGLKTADRIQQMVKNERAIANLIGKYPTYMRPPFSSCTGDCQTDMQKLGYHRVYFDLDSQDYINDDPSLIQQSKDIVKWNLGNETNGQNVLSLQHDGHYQTAYNLSSYYFDQIKAKGWQGVTVGDCLQDPKTNWYRVPGTGKGTS